MKLDGAVLRLLGWEAEKTAISSAGGGGCSSASTYVIKSLDADGNETQYFMKTGNGKDAETMFKGEHESLRVIHSAVPDLCPQSLGYGAFASSPSTHFLISDFLDLRGRGSPLSDKVPSLAQKLAKLHTTPASIPDGFSKPMFGFPVTTCCGDTPQENDYEESWERFYADHRLRFILKRSEKSNGPDDELRNLVEATATKVVPRLIGDRHLNHGKGITPVVVHGDLWSGNAGRGIIGGKGLVHDVIYDSSASYSHSEFELGIMRMFGGFGKSFLAEYHRLCPKTEPVDEYEDRVALYELYHHLNHHALFGSGYRSGAVAIMKKLIHRYGNDNR